MITMINNNGISYGSSLDSCWSDKAGLKFRSRRNHRLIAETIINIELCSILGQKLLVRLPASRYSFSMSNFYNEHERFCSTDNREPVQNMLAENDRPRPVSKSRPARACTLNGNTMSSSEPREFVHTYTFNKTQRLEKWYTLESGLNRIGRLKALCMRKLNIVAPKLLTCPLCSGHIGRSKVHCCSDYLESKKLSTPEDSPSNDLYESLLFEICDKTT